MPTIPLHAPSLCNSHPSPNALPSLLHTPLGLGLVEIQGSLNIPSKPDDGSGKRQIGRIEFPLLNTAATGSDAQEGAWMKQVHFYVGERQRLLGEVKKLEKPVGVMNGKEELEIADIVRWKLYFGSRPEFV